MSTAEVDPAADRDAPPAVELPPEVAAALANLQPQGEPVVPPIVYVSFSAEINPNTTESLIATMANLANQGVPEVYLLFSTPSSVDGDERDESLQRPASDAGRARDTQRRERGLDRQRDLPCRGRAVRLPALDVHVHGVGFDSQPGERLEEKSLREKLESLRADQKRMGSIIEERTHLDAHEVEPLFLEAQTKDATYAVGKGIVPRDPRCRDPGRQSRSRPLVFQR